MKLQNIKHPFMASLVLLLEALLSSKKIELSEMPQEANRVVGRERKASAGKINQDLRSTSESKNQDNYHAWKIAECFFWP